MGSAMTAAARPWYETAFGDLYPLIYAHRDLDEARRCLDLLPRLAPPGPGPILDLGCGQGRHLRLLDERGWPALGVDLSRALLRRARQDAPRQPLVNADMRAIPLADGACSAVLSLFTTFGYFGDADAHAPVVAEIARVLRPGGHWYLDFLNSDLVAATLAAAPAARRREVGPLLVCERRTLRREPRRVVKSVEVMPRPGREAEALAAGLPVAGLRYQEEVTLFSLAELDALAAVGGLHRVAAAGDYAGAPLVAAASDRWLLVYQRPPRGKERP